tara:strand:+ start:148 stop:411 length:264 start_codon:yes stop_codon:yes gene_type:complete
MTAGGFDNFKSCIIRVLVKLQFLINAGKTFSAKSLAFCFPSKGMLTFYSPAASETSNNKDTDNNSKSLSPGSISTKNLPFRMVAVGL